MLDVITFVEVFAMGTFGTIVSVGHTTFGERNLTFSLGRDALVDCVLLISVNVLETSVLFVLGVASKNQTNNNITLIKG